MKSVSQGIIITILFLLLPCFGTAFGTEVGISLYHDFYYLHEHPELAERIVEAHVEWVKIELRMDLIEPEKGVFDFPTEEVTLLHNLGLKIFASVSYSAPWANGGKSKTYPCVNTQDWKDFISALVKEFDDYIDYWGIWNEPGSSQFFSCNEDDCVDAYIDEVLIPASQAIRAQEGTNYVVAPQTNYENWGELNPKGSNGVLFLKQVMSRLQSRGQLDAIDIISHHIFKVFVEGYWKDFKTYLSETGVKEVISAYGKPFWVGDFGWQVTPSQQGERAKWYVDAIYELLNECGAQRVFIYMLNDNQYIADYSGLIYDGSPYTRKKGFYAVKSYQNPQRLHLKYEFEDGFYHLTGRPNSMGWEASTSIDGANFLAYGPYTKKVEGGYRIALFSMMIDNNTVDNVKVVRIEVTNPDYYKPLDKPGIVIASREITRQEFPVAGNFVQFPLPFYHYGGDDQLEFRVYWYDKAYIAIDNVIVPGIGSYSSQSVLYHLLKD